MRLDGPHVEVVGVDELHHDDAKEVVVRQRGSRDQRQATHQQSNSPGQAAGFEL